MLLQSMYLLAKPPPGLLRRIVPAQASCFQLWRQSFSQVHPLQQLQSPTTKDLSPPTNSQPTAKPVLQFANLISQPSNTSTKPIGIKITPAVIERIEQVRKIDNEPNEALRLSVESGGCHGFQYKMQFTHCFEDDDFVFTTGDRNGMVVIDGSSLGLMDGSTIDFATELIGSSFRVVDNPHSAGKGCGCGISWQLK